MLKDVQGQEDFRQMPLKHVGIKNLRWPIVVKDRAKGEQHTVANFTLAVDLPQEVRGTHMSRFVASLRNLGTIHPLGLESILDTMKDNLQAKKAMLEMNFPYFIEKTAPVSGEKALLDLNCHYRAEKADKFSLYICVEVPIHTLCPCSKEISESGAHNQRAIAKLETKNARMVWIEELVEMAEQGVSAPIYSLLKRPDEKYVTELAYATPRFVEDAAREIALVMGQDKRIGWYRVTVESMESIHNHNAFACLERN